MKDLNKDSISLNKYISNTGICSRREADKFITAGRVTINGKMAAKGNRVFPKDVVLIDGRPTEHKPDPVYIAFNKPTGIITTTDLNEPNNIISYINHPQRLFPIGRLDKPSQGLIFLTNDGDVVNKILRAGNNHDKEYIVTVKQRITPKFINKMSQGVKILGTMTKKCEVKQLNDYTFNITLTQGLNRQIRRMCEHLQYNVTKLKRTRIMNVQLSKLKVGHWRELSKPEKAELLDSVADSSMTASTTSSRVTSPYDKRKFNPRSKNKYIVKKKDKDKSEKDSKFHPNPKAKSKRKKTEPTPFYSKNKKGRRR